MSREAMKMALDALESYSKSDYIKQHHPKRRAAGEKAITALRTALAEQPAPEWKPVPPRACIKPTHEAADAFWKYWRENGETHKHGYYESTWGAINAALAHGWTTPELRPSPPSKPNPPVTAAMQRPTMNDSIRADMAASRESFYKTAQEVLAEQPAVRVVNEVPGRPMTFVLAEQPAPVLPVPLPKPISNRLSLTTTIHEGIPSLQRDNVPVVIEGVDVFSAEQMASHARAILACAIPSGYVVVPVEPSEAQVDAPRQILLYYDTQGRTYEGLRQFLDRAGVDYKVWCPEWFKTETGHMTKGGTAILVYAAMLAARPGKETP